MTGSLIGHTCIIHLKVYWYKVTSWVKHIKSDYCTKIYI